MSSDNSSILCLKQEPIDDNFSIEYLRKVVKVCEHNPDQAYTNAFVSLTKLLQHSLACLRGISGHIALTRTESKQLYSVFASNADPTQFIYNAPSLKTQVSRVSIKSDTPIETVKSVQNVVDKCFEILNGMIADPEIKDHLFPNKKPVVLPPAAPKKDMWGPAVKAITAADRLLGNTLLTQIKKLAQDIRSFLAERDPFGKDGAPYQKRYTDDYPVDSSTTDKLLEEADKVDATSKKEILYALMQQLRENFAQMKEKLVGEVQVYLRLKGGSNEGVFKFVDGNPAKELPPIINLQCPAPLPSRGSTETEATFLKRIKMEQLKRELNGQKPFTYDQRDYARIFKSNDTNKQVYESLKDTLDNTLYGRNVMLFGYGYSGSGKTYTLLNQSTNEENMGVLLQWMKNTNASINIHSVFEVYPSFSVNNPPKSDGLSTYSTVEVKLKNFELKADNPNVEYRLSCVHVYGEKLDDVSTYKGAMYDYANEEDTWRKFVLSKSRTAENLRVPEFLKYLDEYRTYQRRIRKTANNEHSSRSHMFIVFKVVTTDHTGYLTIIDMAGREDPIDIVKSEFMINRMETTLLFVTMGKQTATSLGNINSVWFKSPENRSYFINWLANQSPTEIQKFLKVGPSISDWVTGKQLELKSNISVSKVIQQFGKDFNEALGRIEPGDIFNFVKQYPGGTKNFLDFVKTEDSRRTMLLKEGIIINETINHLTSYFRRKKYKYEMQPNREGLTSLIMDKKDDYKPEFVLSNPEVMYSLGSRTSELKLTTNDKPYAIFTASSIYVWNDKYNIFNAYTRAEDITNVDSSLKSALVNKHKEYMQGLQKSLIIPLLKTIEQLGSGKNNFIMLCCARTESQYCENVSKTLDYAREISSRNIQNEVKQIKVSLSGGVRKYRKQNKKLPKVQKRK